jgi:hypothetical protein
MALTARFGFRAADVRVADCTSAEAIGDFVRVSGTQVSNRDQVRKADPSSYAKLPAVGVVISKPTPTTCLVQWMGETPEIFSGLAAGSLYFLGADSRIADNPPAPVGRDMFIQAVAVALSDKKAYIRPTNNVYRRVGV